jgi:hypothetical protein
VALFLALFSAIPTHAVFDVIVDDKVEFFVCEPVVFREYTVNFVDDRLRF